MIAENPRMARMVKARAGSGAPRRVTFGQRLIQAAVAKGAPHQQELLSKWFFEVHGIKVSGPMINRYKNQDALPRLEQAREYALALDVCVEWLLTGRGQKHPGPPITEAELEAVEALRHIDDIGARTDWLGFIKIAASHQLRPPKQP